MKIQKPKSATPSIPAINAIGSVLRILLKSSPKLRKRLMNIGELANYQIWLEEKFGSIKLRNSRERVWKDIDSRVAGKSVHGIELGVAWGYLTYFWITKSRARILTWDAYDLFTGLPRAWRSSPVGAFSNNGKTPNIPDERINWHVGFVEETIQSLEIPSSRDYNLLIFFDLDIYEPSLVAWQKIKPMLKAGDILYFDEAFDVDERSLLENFILTSGEFEFVSANWISLALEIKSLDPKH
jgi:hypothetical protein